MLTDQASPACFAGIDLCSGVFAGFGGRFTGIEDGFATEKESISLGRCRQQGGPAEAKTEENQAKEPCHGNVDRFPVVKLEAH